MTFQTSAFQNSAFQTDPEGGARGGGGKYTPSIAWWNDVPERPERPKKPPRVVLAKQEDGSRVFVTLLPLLDAADDMALEFEQANRLALLQIAEADALVRLKMAEALARRRRNSIAVLLLASV